MSNTLGPYIQINPLDTHRPVPFPPVPGKPTGLICSSSNCWSRVCHSTVYFSPRKQPHAPLIGIRYRLDRFSSEILAHNRKFGQNHRQNPIFIPYKDNNRGGAAKMDFGHLLNAFIPLSPPPTQPTRAIAPSQILPTHCCGYLGRFAEGHLLLKNNKCAIKACFHCCNQLNVDTVCRTHASQSKRKQKEAQQQNELPPVGSSASITASINLSEEPTTQAGRIYSRKLTGPELHKFKTLAIEKQAKQRLHNEGLSHAKKNITFLLWSAPDTDPFGLLAHASQWPLLALDESEDLMKVVHEKLGSESRHSLQVWNEHDEIWLLTPTNLLQSYSTDRRKILIRLPIVNECDCRGLEFQKLSLATSITQGSMDIRRFLTPTASKDSTPIFASTPIHDRHSGSQSDQSIQVISTARKRERSESEDSTDDHEYVAKASKWPQLVSMIKMKAFFDASNRPNMHIKEAWSEVFGKPYVYKKSTASRYRRWLTYVPTSKLDRYVQTHGMNKTIRQATRRFYDAWAKSVQVAGSQPASQPTKHHKS
ncbi:hypothetical protein DFH28DRAFT_1080711 [Melampsora americana]|nr:hypothetical protein DFH28DRAFT_1080711 [Melampsora americana]